MFGQILHRMYFFLNRAVLWHYKSGMNSCEGALSGTACRLSSELQGCGFGTLSPMLGWLFRNAAGWLWVTCVLVIDSDKLWLTRVFGWAVSSICAQHCLGLKGICLCFPRKSYAALSGERYITCECWVRWLYWEGELDIESRVSCLLGKHSSTELHCISILHVQIWMIMSVYSGLAERTIYDILQDSTWLLLMPSHPSLEKPIQSRAPINLIMAFQNRIWSMQCFCNRVESTPTPFGNPPIGKQYTLITQTASEVQTWVSVLQSLGAQKDEKMCW